MAQAYVERGGKYYPTGGGPGLYQKEFDIVSSKNPGTTVVKERTFWDRLKEAATIDPRQQAAIVNAKANEIAYTNSNSNNGLAATVQPTNTVAPVQSGAGKTVVKQVVNRTPPKTSKKVSTPVVQTNTGGGGGLHDDDSGMNPDGSGKTTGSNSENSANVVPQAAPEETGLAGWLKRITTKTPEQKAEDARDMQARVAQILGGDDRTAASLFE